ncbi:MAG: tRNA uridine-5-carboxymethylaminomethyl(34) synthesis enzyme MnmG [Bacteroidales bacterium]
MSNQFDIIVIGAGHAGCEAAYVAATLGANTLLITMDLNKIAQMSCNPSMGGVAKGQVVREIDALGGASALITDASTIQFRMLNSSKGPAMWSPRAQCDRVHFSFNWRYLLERTPNLSLWQDSVSDFIFSSSGVTGVSTSLGATFYGKKVILTAGTFLNGALFIGDKVGQGGRVGEPSSYGLSESLKREGIVVDRMKTGTPPRVDIRSIDLSKLEPQHGDHSPRRFSYLNRLSPLQLGHKEKVCYIGHTNKIVHRILEDSFSQSPLFSGKITGLGPRYCPSIEDKLKSFAGKDSHQLFLEPEGWSTNEYYLQGFSSSLPFEVQMRALKEISGFERVAIYRPAYAVEYDYFPPTQLNHTLESKIIPNLYFAGQVNGTTGYEEAAAQGLIAAINAFNSIKEREPFTLKRDQAYIGVLIDDLVTKGVDEPYRLFTSRAEYRILLRQDNADSRLTHLSHSIGLASDERYQTMVKKYERRDSLHNYLTKTNISPSQINPFLHSIGESLIDQPRRFSDLLKRPSIILEHLLPYVPRETFDSEPALSKVDILPYFGDSAFRFTSESEYLLLSSSFRREILESVEISIKYQGYIERERKAADKLLRLEEMEIPENFNYRRVASLSNESKEKLMSHRPTTISQASRIPGVSPADIAVLILYFGR